MSLSFSEVSSCRNKRRARKLSRVQQWHLEPLRVPHCTRMLAKIWTIPMSQPVLMLPILLHMFEPGQCNPANNSRRPFSLSSSSSLSFSSCHFTLCLLICRCCSRISKCLHVEGRCKAYLQDSIDTIDKACLRMLMIAKQPIILRNFT